MRNEITIDDRKLTADEIRVVLNALDAYSTLLQGNFSQLAQYFVPFGAYDPHKVRSITESFRKASHEMDEAQRKAFGGESKCLAVASAPRHAIIAEILRHEIDGNEEQVKALKDLAKDRSIWDDPDMVGPDDEPV